MADETNVHVKVAMAEVLGLISIAFFTITVGFFGIKAYDSLAVVVAVSVPCGLTILLAAYIGFLNENILVTAIFGLLGMFFLAIGSIPADVAGACAIGFIAVVFFVYTLISLAQPVKMLPVILVVAAVAFVVTALFYNDGSNRELMGWLWIIVAAIAVYMAAAIMMLVLKGKQVLPLLIKA